MKRIELCFLGLALLLVVPVVEYVEAHEVLDGGPSSATTEHAKTITRFIQRFGELKRHCGLP